MFIFPICAEISFEKGKVPEFDVNLDEAPETRFLKVNIHFKKALRHRTYEILKILPWFDKLAFYFLYPLIKLLHYDYYMELSSLSDIIDIPLYQVAAVDFFNEELNYCTSMCLRQNDGSIVHGRNLDTHWLGTLQNTTYIAHFYRDGKHVYDSVLFAGFTGTYTAVKPGSFSMSINLRKSKSAKYAVINLLNIFRGVRQDSWLLREAMEKLDTYDEAVSFIKQTEGAATDYFIICGKTDNEGTVITKNRNEVVNERTLTEETWYLVQTNKDHFADVKDIRYLKAVEILNTHNYLEIGSENVMDSVMLQRPPAQANTIYSSIFVPNTHSSMTKLTTYTPKTDKSI